MCDQLDVFLQQETKGFVDRLFVTLENKSYLQSNPEPPPPSVPGAAAKEELHPSIGVASVNGSSIPPPSSSSTTVAPPYAAAAASAAVPENVARESRTSSSSSNKQKTEQRSSGGGKRRSWSPRSRSRSRDRGQLRQQRSRSPRDRSSRGGGSRNWDDRRSRRSPPVGSSSGGSSQRRSDQRDQRGGGGRRSRSPPRRSSRSPPRRRNQRPSSRSPPPTSSKGENSDKTMTTTTTATDVTGTAPPSVQSVIVAPAGVAAAAGGNKFRCRDYDEKGYCMRGDLCPYDHGNDPVVLEDVELSSMLNYNRPPPGAATAVAAPPPSAVVVVPPPHHHLRGPPPSLSQLPPSVGGEPYNPDAPGISWPPPPMVAGPAGIVPLRPMPPYGVHGGPPYHRGMPPVPVPSHAMRSHPMAHHQHHPHHHNQHRPQMRGGGGGGHPPPMGLLGQAPPSSGGVGRELISVPTAGMGVGGDDVGDLSAALSGGTNKRNVIEAGLDAVRLNTFQPHLKLKFYRCVVLFASGRTRDEEKPFRLQPIGPSIGARLCCFYSWPWRCWQSTAAAATASSIRPDQLLPRSQEDPAWPQQHFSPKQSLQQVWQDRQPPSFVWWRPGRRSGDFLFALWGTSGLP